MNNTSPYYKESGAVGLKGIIFMALGGLIAGLILGAIYAYAIFYIPFIYISFLLTIGFGVGVGFAVGKAATFGQVRNGLAVIVAGAIAGIVASYFGWVFWIHAASEQTLLSFSPGLIFENMASIAEFGAWSIFGWTPSGIALYVIWTIEALIILVASVIFALAGFGREPFCEGCNNWTKSEVISSSLEIIENPTEFVTALEGGDLTPLTNLALTDPSEHLRTKVELISCSRCEESHFATVEIITVEVDDKGEADENEHTIIENLILDDKGYDKLIKWRDSLQAVE